MIDLESRLEKYKKIKKEKKLKRARRIIVVFSIIILILGMNVVDRAVRDMMCIYDKQLCFFNYNNETYRFHLFGKDYFVEKKEINDKIYNTKVILEDYVRSTNDYLDRIIKIIKTR